MACTVISSYDDIISEIKYIESDKYTRTILRLIILNIYSYNRVGHAEFMNIDIDRMMATKDNDYQVISSAIKNNNIWDVIDPNGLMKTMLVFTYLRGKDNKYEIYKNSNGLFVSNGSSCVIPAYGTYTPNIRGSRVICTTSAFVTDRSKFSGLYPNYEDNLRSLSNILRHIDHNIDNTFYPGTDITTIMRQYNIEPKYLETILIYRSILVYKYIFDQIKPCETK